MGGRGGSSGLSSVGVSFDMNGNEYKFNDSIKIIKKMSQEYDTRLREVTVGAKNAAGDVDMYGYKMRLNSNDQSVAIHEFAHTLANTYTDKLGVTHHNEFWKEIKKIQREYRKKVGQDSSRWISAYGHSSKGSDEFFAEAFTHAKMRSMGIKKPDKYGSDYTYSEKVLNVVDKYFKKKKRKR